MEHGELFKQCAEAIRQAQALLITAGAGMGVDSGLPDFRGAEGFWNAYPVYRQLGLNFTELANPVWFHTDPALAWGFYGHRMNLYREAQPHAGFEILRTWAAGMPMGSRVFTSNVDGHFQRAGFAPDSVTEIHGSIHHLQCTALCGIGIFPADDVRVSVDEKTFRAGSLPRCPKCQALARPNILMFGDWEWSGVRTEAQKWNLNNWLAGLKGKRLVVIELGAGTAIPTVRTFSEHAAAGHGGLLIRINLRDPEARRGHIGLACGALEGLRGIQEAMGA